MKLVLKLTSLLGMALSLAAVARADQFELTYAFFGPYSQGDDDTIVSTFDGTLNGNLITGITDATMTLYDSNAPGGVLEAGLFYAEGYGEHGSVTDGTAVVSVDGTQNDFLFVNSDFAAGDSSFSDSLSSITGTANDAYDEGDGFFYAYSYSPTYLAAIEDSGGSVTDPLNDSWTVTELSKVPDGGTAIALLGGALTGLAMLRRRFGGR